MLRGNWRKRLKIVGMQERLEHFLRQKLRNRRGRLAREAEQRGQLSGGLPIEVGGGARAEGGEGGGEEGPDSVETVVGSWIDNDMVKGFVTTNRDLFLTLMKVRVITAGLATQVRFGRQDVEAGDKLCRRCGQRTGKPETNWHVLWECTDPGVVKQRASLQKRLEQLLEKGGLRRSRVVVAMAMWRLGEGGVGLKWEGWDAVASSAEMMEGMEPEAAEQLERSMTALDGTALDLARKGLIGADYRNLLVQLGMTKRGAGTVAQGVQKLLSSARGIGGMWKVFSEDLPREHREPGTAERYSLKGVRKALQDLQEQAKGSRVMLGAEDRVFTKQYKSGNKLKWLQEYDELRARGLGMRTAMRGAYEVVRKAVRAAAREKGDRRGVRGMFERQRRRLQAEQARQATGAQRSLQEEWDMEEDGGGEEVVRSDEEGSTQMGFGGSGSGDGKAAGEVEGDTGEGSDGYAGGHSAEGREGRGDGDRGRIQVQTVAEDTRCEAPAEAGKEGESKGRKRHRGRKGSRAQGKRQKGGVPPSGAEGSTGTGVAGNGSRSGKLKRKKKSRGVEPGVSPAITSR